MTTGSRPIHDFCWINLMTPELDRAAAFYAELFGWTYAGGVPGGRLIQVDGRPAGALMDLAAPGMPAGMAPGIGVMVKVADADATVVRVNELGGHSKGAFDVLVNGRMAVCKDPNGAEIDIWQPKEKDGAEHDSRAHGAPTWFETVTTDVDPAISFYQRLFGWIPKPQSSPHQMTYTVFELDGRPIGGAMRLLPQMKGSDAPPRWAVTFAVRDADETVRLGARLGATVHVPPSDIPNVGRFAMLESPQGVGLGLLQWQS